MTKLRDYDCACGVRFEYLHHGEGDEAACPSCGGRTLTDVVGAARPFHVIIPMYRGSLKQKAGFVHTHADRPAEKGSVAMPRTGDFK